MTNGSLATAKLTVVQADEPASEETAAPASPLRQQAARQIAIETKRLWREAQLAGLDELATMMEEAFYRAYQEAGGAKVMRAV